MNATSPIAGLTFRIHHTMLPVADLERSIDFYTRLFGMTNLSAILPPWALEGGPQEIAARLQDSATREKMKAHPSIVKALARDDWSRLVVTNCRARPEAAGATIAALAQQKRRPAQNGEVGGANPPRGTSLA